MFSINFISAVAASSLLTMAAAADSKSSSSSIVSIPTPTVTLPANPMVPIGCFETPHPLENHGSYIYQSDGNCQLICIMLGKPVLGLSEGTDCWCGDMLPAKEWQVPNSTCSTTCAGDDSHDCGGAGKLWVKLTGTTRNKVENYVPDHSSSMSKSAPSSSETSAASSSSAPADSDNGGGPNKAGIAAGVVVGVVALAGIIGAVAFFLRRRRQQQAEEDYRRNVANVNSFVSGGMTAASSMNDSRLDPSFVDRRQSNGSIADNEDYSRRILKVTNV